MPEKEPQKTVAKLKRKRKKKSLLNYLLLFIIVFTICVILFLSGIKSYTPTADVAIGNEESVTMNDEDLDFEIKSVDERLKWIQMEDDLPTVAVRNSKTDNNVKMYAPDTTTKLEIEDDEKPSVKKDIASQNKIQETQKQPTIQNPIAQKPVAPKPSINEVATEKADFRTAQLPKAIVPLPTRPQETLTKVYLGNFTSLEDAMIIQKKVSSDFPDTAPFIKATNNYYMVQLGSFSDKDKANTFIYQLRSKGYSPKTL